MWLKNYSKIVLNKYSLFNRQQTTYNLQPTTDNRQQTTYNRQPTT